jgi:hypothetical protein
MREEALVVVADTRDADDIWDQLRRQVRVTQALLPRLALVALDEAAAAALAEVPGITVHRARPPGMADLREDEKLFVAAWVTRLRSKDRPGDGLSWDAPGYHPPDMPKPPR